MIKKLFFLFLICCAIVAIEIASVSFIDMRWKPDLALLIVIFMTLSLGFRYGFAAALMAGFLKEGFVSQHFGTMLVPYLLCVYLADYLKKRLSLQESLVSRLGVVCICLLLQVTVQAFFFAVYHPINWMDLGMGIVIPQILTTIMFAEVFFNICRPCASKLFV